MIHSMAGGNLGRFDVCDFAKVKFLTGNDVNKESWFKCQIVSAKVGDICFVYDNSNQLVEGEIVRIDKQVSSFSSPVPYKRAKSIIKMKT